jgi:small-conductance mechanosensitive channel
MGALVALRCVFNQENNMPLPALVLPAIPALASLSLGALAVTFVKAIPFMLTAALVFLGITWITVTGVTAGFDFMINSMLGVFNGLPSNIATLMKIAGIPEALSYVLSAISFKISLQLVSGTLRFLTFGAARGSL